MKFKLTKLNLFLIIINGNGIGHWALGIGQWAIMLLVNAQLNGNNGNGNGNGNVLHNTEALNSINLTLVISFFLNIFYILV